MSPLQAETLTTLRQALQASGFTTQAVEQLTAAADQRLERDLRRVALALTLEEHPDQRLAVFMALFQLGLPVETARARALFPALDIAGLVELEVLRVENDHLEAAVRIDELDGLFLASDMHGDGSDVVVGVSPSTRLSVAYTPQVDVQAVLDMGCGLGAHSLLAARRCENVVATDINARALKMTRLNAALNEIGNVETRQGSWFEPVAGERFDLVVANPPYVISPDSSFLFRDSGLDGDAISRVMLAELPSFLREGGFASLQGNWAHKEREPWWQAPTACLASSGCDALIVRLGTHDPLPYAIGWPAPHFRGDPDGYEQTVRRWRESYRVAGTEKISAATVILRRRAATNWRRTVTRTETPPLAMRAHWPQVFEMQDRLAVLDGAALLDARMRPVAGMRVELGTDGEGGRSCTLQADISVGGRRPVSRSVAELVLGLGGGARPTDIAAAGEVAGEELRTLVKLGFLELV